MILLSSIFSFSTLRRPRTWPAGALFALLLIGAAELATRALLAGHVIERDPTLRTLILQQLDDVRATHSNIWLLGNSTLEYGVDERALSTSLGYPVPRLIHGSATVEGSAAMLAYYLQRVAVPPKTVIFLITKDDLNPNGYRAKVSETYLQIERTGNVPGGDYLALRAARGSIKNHVAALDSELYAGLRRAVGASRTASLAQSSTLPDSQLVFGGKIVGTEKTFIDDLDRNYAIDAKGLNDLAQVGRNYHVQHMVVIMLPITDVLAAYHDAHIPQYPYAKVRANVAMQCQRYGIEFIDWGQPSTDHASYRDAYHLNDRGAKLFTARLAQLISASYTSNPP